MGSSRIAVVTDSSAYIPEEALQGLDVTVIPLWVHWGDDRFRDGVDIDPQTFYRRLQESPEFPTTSQPSIGEFEEFFRRVGAGMDAVVAVLVTSQLSGTVASALGALERIPEMVVRVVDSQMVSMGLGFSVLAAARAAAAGKPVEAVVAAAEDMRDRVHLLFAVDTLEFLHRGGRIGGARWLLGSALQIKPLLHMMDGTIQSLVQVRTKRKALVRMLQVVEERLAGTKMAEAAVIDANCPGEAAAVAEKVRERFGLKTVYRSVVSPAIGTHAGPGTVGIAFYAEA
jgi:DegV family protein with EDD domain